MCGRPTSWLGLSLTARSSGEAAHDAEMGRARRHCGALTGGSVVAGRWQGSASKLAGGHREGTEQGDWGGAHPNGGAAWRQRRSLRIVAFIGGERAPVADGDGGVAL
jgi:hypothetical protein